MRTIAFCMVLGTLVSSARATPQAPEWLIYEGRIYAFFYWPLESYFDQGNPRPEELYMSTTGHRRGYIGTWTIHENTLYLQSLARPSCSRLSEDIPIACIFKDLEIGMQKGPTSGVGIGA